MSDHLRELDHRSHDGIDVQLLWREDDDRAIVKVADAKTGERFSIEVPDGERALNVFHHPYAFAAWHRIDTRSPTHEHAPDQLHLRAA
jgi:hypothetical protein